MVVVACLLVTLTCNCKKKEKNKQQTKPTNKVIKLVEIDHDLDRKTLKITEKQPNFVLKNVKRCKNSLIRNWKSLSPYEFE